MFFKELKKYRTKNGLSIKELAQQIGIDPSLLSRIERNERPATEQQVKDLAKHLNAPTDAWLSLWVQDKLEKILAAYPTMAHDVLKAMETRIEYLSGPKALEVQKIPATLKKQLQKIDALRDKWIKTKPTKGIAFDKLHESFAVEYTYESNKIEGNTLTLQETYLVIHDGLTIGGKSVQEHLEAINHDEAIEFVMGMTQQHADITEYKLKQIHHLVLKGIDRKNAGVYRSVGVRISGSNHLPPEPFLVPKLMEELFEFYENEKHRMHPVLLAAEMHERFVTIHPFVDGNGRTGRLLMNFILLQHGYTLAILKGNKTNRFAYYNALEKVQIDGKTEPFFTLIANAVQESLTEHLKFV